MLHKSLVYNVLVEEMYFSTKVACQISTFWTFHLPEVVKIPHVKFETRSKLLYRIFPFCV